MFIVTHARSVPEKLLFAPICAPSVLRDRETQISKVSGSLPLVDSAYSVSASDIVELRKRM